MLKSHPQKRGKAASRYHHGDLRAALVLAAREALRNDPPGAIQLKDLAKRLGVSQPAPYRHFSSRDSLMAAVASDGFDRLLAALTAATQLATAEPALERLCLAYLDFGAENVGVYRLMFSRKTLGTTSEASDPADASFALLTDHVAKKIGTARATIAAVSIWATLHGLVTLSAEGLLSGPQLQPISAENMIRESVISLLNTQSGRTSS